jgi:hypothetical protein
MSPKREIKRVPLRDARFYCISHNGAVRNADYFHSQRVGGTEFAIATGAGIVMVSWCANPDCRRELRYFREGKIYAFLMLPATGNRRLEHFWLCGECSKTMNLVCADHREVRLLHRPASASLEAVVEPNSSPASAVI